MGGKRKGTINLEMWYKGRLNNGVNLDIRGSSSANKKDHLMHDDDFKLLKSFRVSRIFVGREWNLAACF